MTIKLYAAVVLQAQHELLDGKHITVAFCDPLESDKLFCLQAVEALPIVAVVQSVEFWPQANITVARFVGETFEDVKGVFENAGFTYNDHAFKPHVTLCEGDKVEEHSHLVGQCVSPIDTYIRIKDFKD